MALSDRIRRHRLAASLTVKQLAVRLGTRQWIVAGYESGAKVPTAASLAKIARALEVELEALTRPDVGTSQGPR